MTALDVYSTREAARRCGVEPGTLVRWRMLGTGPAFHKINRRVVYSKADFDEWFGAQRRTSTSATGGVGL